MEEAIETTFTIIHGHGGKGGTTVTPYLTLVPSEGLNAESEQVSISHVRTHSKPTLYEVAGGREFTVAWCLIPLVEEPEKVLEMHLEDSLAEGEDGIGNLKPSNRAVAVAYGVGVYNHNDSKSGNYFNKAIGAATAITRLMDQVNALNDEEEASPRLAGVFVLEVGSSVCENVMVNGKKTGFLRLPRTGPFLYRAVQRRIEHEAAETVSNDLDLDLFDFSGNDDLSADELDNQLLENLDDELAAKHAADALSAIPNGVLALRESESEAEERQCSGCGNCECNRAS